MSNFDGVLDPASGWPDIPQASTSMVVLGGAGGPLNEQATQLTARTKKLKEDIENISPVGFGGQYKNLVVTVSGVGYQGTITADRLVVESSDYKPKVLCNINVEFNGANIGVNGLDVNSITAGNWYYLFVIYNPITNTTATVISLSSASPTLPNGYTMFAMVGVARVPSGYTRFLATHQRDAWVSYAENDFPSLVNGSNTTTLTYVDTTSSAPPITKEMSYIKYSSNVGSGIYYPSNTSLNDTAGSATINIVETTYRGFWYKNSSGQSWYAAIAYRI